MKSLVRAGLAAVFLLAAPFSAWAHSEPLKIRIGYSDAAMHLTPVIFQKPEILKHYGKSYVVEARNFTGGPAQVTALAAGEVEIVAASFQTLPQIVNKAKIDVRVIADVIQSSVPGYADMLFMAKKGRFKSPAEVKGKIVAVGSLGSGIDASMRHYLASFSLLPDRDYTIVEVRFSNMLVALRSGRVDIGSFAPPYSIDAENAGEFETLFKYGDMIGPNQASMWIAQKSWLEKNRAALNDFFEDFLLSRRWFLDPANQSEAVKMVSNVTKRPAEDYQGWLLTKRDWYRDPNGYPNADMIQQNIDNSVKAKTLDETINVKDYMDVSFIEEARKRVGSR